MSIYYRPDIHNGTVAKRPPRIKPSTRPVRSSQPPLAEGRHQSRTLWCLIVFGACIAAGFVFSLHQHFTANAIGREDVRLKANLDQAFSEQRHLELKRERAFSLREIERVANQRGNLAPLKLDSSAALRATPAVMKRGSLSRADAQPASEKIAVQSQDDRRADRHHDGPAYGAR